MRLENIAIDLRPRSAWEAIDLGYAMAQQWSRPIFFAWCAVYFPAALLINLLCWQQPAIAVAVLWWLKPAFDRVVLHVLSGATFGAVPTLKETLRALPRLWWNNRLAVSLTYGRFDFARSFHLPIIQLEGGRGKALRQRRRVLGRDGRGAAVWLTIICLHLEVVLIASCYLLVNLFTPGDATFQFSWAMLFDPEVAKSRQLFSNAVSAMAISILEPFYVAAGFAIYLNCRTAIEGWDVELAFKRLSERVNSTQKIVASTNSKITATVALVLALSFGAVFQVSDSLAQNEVVPLQVTEKTSEEQTTVQVCRKDDDAEISNILLAAPSPTVETYTPHTGAEDAANRVIDSKEFGQTKEGWRIKYIGPNWDKKEPPKNKNWQWLERIVKFFAESARVLAWIGLTIVVAVLLYAIARYINLNGWVRVGRKARPDVLFGLDVRPESLPDDVPQTAHQLLMAGDLRGAVSLLYRGALIALIQDGRIDIGRGDTEGECIRRVRQAYFDAANMNGDAAPRPSKAGYFAALVLQWQRVAYAREMVLAAEIEPLIADWPQHFVIQRANEEVLKTAPKSTSKMTPTLNTAAT